MSDYPKLTISFPMTEEYKDEAKLTMHAMDMAAFITEFQQYLRQLYKYEDIEALDRIYTKWFEIKEEYIPGFSDLYK